MTQHKCCWANRGQRICNTLSFNVRGRAMNTIQQKSNTIKCKNWPTHGSPITKLSPALTEGMRPREPTRAAAASLWYYQYVSQKYFFTHEMMSPYKFGATMTSKTLLFKGECGQGICMRIPPPTQVPGTNFAVVNNWTSIKWTNTPVNSTINKLLSNGHIIVSAIYLRQTGDTSDSLTEDTIGDWKNVGLVDDCEMLQSEKC